MGTMSTTNLLLLQETHFRTHPLPDVKSHPCLRICLRIFKRKSISTTTALPEDLPALALQSSTLLVLRIRIEGPGSEIWMGWSYIEIGVLRRLVRGL
ncbi:hypothetical protein CVT25_000224 [Psilocybe cyanescens]|uniref:Uncharacterized protein n=1 Tax=Psilocybe cyanescens TaxID=93625 RepID=A0A409WE42_PSICY|nr:hypothetical protein CVT25_000224 [Psilocybe cyanescens]